MDTTLLPDAKYRRLDLFPAEIPGRKGNKRIVVTDSHIIILGDSNQGPTVDQVGTLYDFSGNNKIGWTAQLDSEEGETIFFKQSQGCGCGSKLRGAKIYRGIPLKAR